MNAIKHGLSARAIVIGDEDPQQLEALRDGLEAYFGPVGALESELVDQATGLLWRLRRVPVVESAIVKHLQEKRESSQQPRIQSAAEVKALERKLLLARCKAEIQEEGGNVFQSHKDGTYQNRVEAALREREAEEKTLGASESETDLVINPSEQTVGLDLLLSDWDGNETLGKLLRYETSLMNTLTRTLKLLHSLQETRKSSEDEPVVEGIV
jgi:hypothetical protein